MSTGVTTDFGFLDLPSSQGELIPAIAAGKVAHVHNLSFHNRNTIDEQIYIYKKKSGTAVEIDGITVSARSTYFYQKTLHLFETDSLEGVADHANKVRMTATGVLETL